jgi:hypothetical protein
VLATLAAMLATLAALITLATLTTTALLTLTPGLLILLAGFLLTALLARILVLIAHEATPICGIIPRQENKAAQHWFLKGARSSKSAALNQ